jgi:hypothetical protein
MLSLQNSVAYLKFVMATNFCSFTLDSYGSKFSSVRIGYRYGNELRGVPDTAAVKCPR